jgi:hypothetical protein
MNTAAAAPNRKEIRDLSNIELILLREGLAKFQNERNKEDPKSWFQVAGIHLPSLCFGILYIVCKVNHFKVSTGYHIRPGQLSHGTMIFHARLEGSESMGSVHTAPSSS